MVETGIYKEKKTGIQVQISLRNDEFFPYEISNLNGKYLDSCTESVVNKHYEYIGKQIPLIQPNINFENHPWKAKEMETIEPLNKYQRIGESIGRLVDEKNKAYGDSFNKSADFLKILYPNGVQPNQYGDMLAIVRIFDKLVRIATDKDALGENPFKDIGGYSILKCEE